MSSTTFEIKTKELEKEILQLKASEKKRVEKEKQREQYYSLEIYS